MPPKDHQPSQVVCLMAVRQEDQVQSVLGMHLPVFRDEVVLKMYSIVLCSSRRTLVFDALACFTG